MKRKSKVEREEEEMKRKSKVESRNVEREEEKRRGGE